jgi:hypothetical protein
MGAGRKPAEALDLRLRLSPLGHKSGEASPEIELGPASVLDGLRHPDGAG